METVLEKDTVISGVPIAKGNVTYYGAFVSPESRTLAMGVLSADYTANNILIPKGSLVGFSYYYGNSGEEPKLGELNQFTPSRDLEVIYLPTTKD